MQSKSIILIITALIGTVYGRSLSPDNLFTSNRVPGAVSEAKCREYSKFVISRRPSPVSMINAPTISTIECGHEAVKLVVGGKNASRKEFPHMVAIGYEKPSGKIEWLCGGTIVSSRFILTAAHCLKSSTFSDAVSPKYVKTGITDLEDRGYWMQQIKIAKTFQYRSDKTHYHDIALLKLQNALNLNPYARPACLYSNINLNVKKAVATGWGTTTYLGISSKQLLKVVLDRFESKSCKTSFQHAIQSRFSIDVEPETQLCAGSEDGTPKDTCQGDSGGPLQIFHDSRKDNVTCMYDIIGITSVGNACLGKPALYTRVAYYIKWVEDIVWPIH